MFILLKTIHNTQPYIVLWAFILDTGTLF